MKTNFKLVLMSFGVTMLVTVGVAVVSLYTYHQGASLHQSRPTGPSATAMDTLPVQTAGIANRTTTAAPQASVADTQAVTPKASGAHDNGHSPFDDPQNVLSHVPANNPAMNRQQPAFLR